MAKLTSEDKKERYCPGCRQDFYNGKNDLGVKNCWHLVDSEVGWQNVFYSIHQTKPKRVRTLNCYSPEMRK